MSELIQTKEIPQEHPIGEKRSYQHDYLRVFAMLMVMLNHVADVYLFWDPPMQIMYIYEGIAHCAVPIFLMLTGVFALKKAGKVSPKEFYLDALKKLGIPCAFFVVIYYAYDLYIGALDWAGVWSTFLTGFCGVYAHWYVGMLAVIYAFLPLIAFVKKNVPYEKYEKAAIVFFVWCVLGFHVEGSSTTWSLVNLDYMGYVLMGDVITTRIRRHNIKNNIVGALLFLLGLILLCVNHTILYNKMLVGESFYGDAMYTYYGAPAIAISSLIIFAGGSMMEMKRSVSLVAKASYTVFLCHKLIISLVINHTEVPSIIAEWLNWNMGLVALAELLLLFLVSFAVALVFDFILEKTLYRK